VVGSGRALDPEAVEEHRVAPTQLDVVEGPPSHERVIGDLQHVVGLVVGPVHLEQVQRGVDLLGQADVLDQLGDHAHAAVRGRLGAL
jgi:hypothetical protein